MLYSPNFMFAMRFCCLFMLLTFAFAVRGQEYVSELPPSPPDLDLRSGVRVEVSTAFAGTGDMQGLSFAADYLRTPGRHLMWGVGARYHTFPPNSWSGGRAVSGEVTGYLSTGEHHPVSARLGLGTYVRRFRFTLGDRGYVIHGLPDVAWGIGYTIRPELTVAGSVNLRVISCSYT
ncbi:MAG: hypothetical protein WBA12_13375 [Catalinimonas sp.]